MAVTRTVSPLVVSLAALGAIVLWSRRARAGAAPGATELWPELWPEETPVPPPRPSPEDPPLGARPERNLTPAEREARWGPLTFERTPGSQVVRITNGYAERFIESRPVPRLGVIKLRPEAHDALAAVVRDLQAEGLDGLLRNTYGGFAPRTVENSPNLSAHAYGTALDINADRNPLGGSGDPDQRRLVPYFERRGWYWGGRFAQPDPMHFEYVG